LAPWRGPLPPPPWDVAFSAARELHDTALAAGRMEVAQEALAAMHEAMSHEARMMLSGLARRTQC
jgi:fructose-bisphosphate aldolase class 1